MGINGKDGRYIIVNVKYNLKFTIINYLKCLAHPQTKVCYVRIGK